MSVRAFKTADHDFYRTRTLDLIRTLKISYDLDAPRFWSTTISQQH